MEAMGGTSGAIFSIFFQCASKAFVKDNSCTVENWIKGISMGIDGVMQHGKSKVGDRTLLDALHSGLERMKKNRERDMREALEALFEGCREGCEATKQMKPKSGRSCYSLSDKGENYEFKSEYPDPGAYAVFVIVREILKTLKDPSH
jgi:dihydroxyacetone kinase